jgi:hypothetical protein
MGDIDITEDEESSTEELSLKQIILSHIKKISEMVCQELTKGYWEDKPVKTSGGVIILKKYHPDLMEGYCNAVNFLIDVVYPWADTKFQTYIEAIEKEDEPTEIKERLLLKRKIFKEINIMFERKHFFDSKEFGRETFKQR